MLLLLLSLLLELIPLLFGLNESLEKSLPSVYRSESDHESFAVRLLQLLLLLSLLGSWMQLN